MCWAGQGGWWLLAPHAGAANLLNRASEAPRVWIHGFTGPTLLRPVRIHWPHNATPRLLAGRVLHAPPVPLLPLRQVCVAWLAGGVCVHLVGGVCVCARTPLPMLHSVASAASELRPEEICSWAG